MGTFVDAAKNTMLDALTVDQVSLHTADPGATGANEVTGGTYARQSITHAAASAGSRDSTNQPVFDVPAGTTVTHVGYWNAAGPTFLGSDPVTNEAFAADGTYTLTDSDLTISDT